MSSKAQIAPRTTAGSRSLVVSDLAVADPETFSPDSPIHFGYIDLGSVEEPGAAPVVTEMSSIGRPSRAQRLVRRGDLLVSNVRPYLRNFTRLDSVPTKIPIVASTGFTVLRPKDEKLGAFVLQALLSEAFQRWIRPRMTGTGYPAITANDIRSFPIPLKDQADPSSVSDFLESIDHTDRLLHQISNQARRSKKALLQALAVPRAKHPFHFRIAELGSCFAQRSDTGKPGLPVYSVTMNSGMVKRSSLDRRVESELTPEQHLLVRRNDIAYNMMRMWQGVSGLAPSDGLVSPAYVVLRPLEGIDPLFASYLFKLPETIRLFHRYSQGLTNDRLRLYYDQFAEIRLPIPEDIEEQRRIAKLLSSIDQRIRQTELFITSLRRTKAALCQKIFS